MPMKNMQSETPVRMTIERQYGGNEQTERPTKCNHIDH